MKLIIQKATTMIKKIAVIIIVLFLICTISTSCIIEKIMDMKIKHLELSPICQLNTTWVSDNIVFSVDSDLNSLGKLRSDLEIINVQILFGKGLDTGIIFKNYDTMLRENFSYSSDYLLFYGDCQFEEDNFTVDVTESKIDCIKVGDKITFNKVEGLPDWANETDMGYEDN